ncbi:MAG TPA: hypothetical protein VNY05_20160 [Candidatus Acidoferrales bacterium]|jgi:hypothetical protein|nr:hypothetical protein [Candidatus Acidoferrales bacterium]
MLFTGIRSISPPMGDCMVAACAAGEANAAMPNVIRANATRFRESVWKVGSTFEIDTFVSPMSVQDSAGCGAAVSLNEW